MFKTTFNLEICPIKTFELINKTSWIQLISHNINLNRKLTKHPLSIPGLRSNTFLNTEDSVNQMYRDVTNGNLLKSHV